MYLNVFNVFNFFNSYNRFSLASIMKYLYRKNTNDDNLKIKYNQLVSVF